MGEYIQDKKTGQMKGRIGDGKSNIPPHDDSPVLPETDDSFDSDHYELLYERFIVQAQATDMPTLYDIMDKEEYEASLAAGHIRTQVHPDFPYLIHNYTESCTWENGWNNATLTCRGLITHAETGEVIARPFPKFFNHGQEQAAQFALDEDVVVMDKADGSLGVGFKLPDGSYSIATRGSFASDQAGWANEIYQEKYAEVFKPNPNWTYLYEIILKENRIVLDYGDMRDLIMLGAVDIRTGRNIHIEEASEGWSGPTVQVFPHTTLREALEAPSRENAEGFVIWNPRTDDRVKVKQEDYIRLHRILTGSTTLSVWEALSSGQDPEEALMDAPDEFQDALKQNIAEFRVAFDGKKNAAVGEYESLRSRLDGQYGVGEWGRKEFADSAKGTSDPSSMFLLLDDRDIDERVWRKLRPVGGQLISHIVSDDAES